MNPIKKILYPTDFSKPSLGALDYAVEFAKMFQAQLEIVHVMFDETQVVSFYLPQITSENLLDDMEKSAEKQLAEFVRGNSSLEGLDVNFKLLKGTPFVEIIKEAKEYGADMIVIGTHGRTGLEHVLFGSTAEKVVRKSPCPVFSVRDRETEFKMP